MTAPVKRGPGRPRKVVPKLAEKPLVETDGDPADIPEVAEEPAQKERPHDPDDPRIGQEVHPTATHVGFDDGTQYLAAGGFITERVT